METNLSNTFLRHICCVINVVTARKRSCGKVMFLQVSVILFIWGGVPGLGGCLVRGVPGPGGVPGVDLPRTATAAGGMHPTGMHSCS